VPTWAKFFGVALLVLSLVGLGYGFPYIIQHGRSENWSWWGYLGALPVIGVLAFLGEAIARVVFAPLRWGGKDQPLWKRGIFAVIVLAIGAGLVVGPLWLASLGK
jgi:hypothetical protein